MDLRVGQAGAERAGRVLRQLGAARLATALRPADNVRVALLHEVGADDVPRLRDLLERLLELRRPLAPAELLRMCAGPPSEWSGGPRLTISFDDGLLSSYEATQAVLNPLGLKAAFFIPTMVFELRSEEEMRRFCIDNVKRGASPRPEQFLTMSRDHVVELHRQGHAIYPHTHSHAALAAMRTPEDVDRELRAPRAILEDLVQGPAAAFALPFGEDRSVAAYGYRGAERLYDACFTSIPGANSARTDRHRLWRDGFHPYDPPGHVMDICEGVLDVPYAVKMWRLCRRADRAE